MAEQATIDQLRALLGQLTAEQDQQRAATENAKRDDELSPSDRITLIRAEQALNGRSVSGEQLEHVLRILEGLTSETAQNKNSPSNSLTTETSDVLTIPSGTQRSVSSDVSPTTEQHTVHATEQQPQSVQPTEYAGLIGV